MVKSIPVTITGWKCVEIFNNHIREVQRQHTHVVLDVISKIFEIFTKNPILTGNLATGYGDFLLAEKKIRFLEKLVDQHPHLSKFVLIAYKKINNTEMDIRHLLNYSWTHLFGNMEPINATSLIESFYGEEEYRQFQEYSNNIKKGNELLSGQYFSTFISSFGLSEYIKSMKNIFTVTTLKSLEFETATHIDQDYKDILHHLQRIPASADHLEQGLYASLFSYICFIGCFLVGMIIVKLILFLYRNFFYKKEIIE